VLPVLTAAEMRQADRHTIEEIGLPAVVLMENAGSAVTEAIRKRYPTARRPAILCGRGSNGGDGFVVARKLRDLHPEVYLMGIRDDVRDDARLHLEVFEKCGGKVFEVADAQAWERARERLRRADLVVDALLGTGLKAEPSGLVADAIKEITRLRELGVPAVALDLPSGVPSDTGDLPWPVVPASLTVALGAAKYGHVLPPSCDWVGDLVIADIGIPRESLDKQEPSLFLLEAADVLRAYDERAPGSHKGTYGHLLVVAGSLGKTGAAVLAATAALRGGVGLVTVATPAPALGMVAAGRPELMTEPIPVNAAGNVAREGCDRVLSIAATKDAVVIGPGLGQDAGIREFVREFVRRCPVPLLVDADGLNALAPPAGGRIRGALDALELGRPTVLTPHPGEMARLAGLRPDEVQKRRLETARSLARETGALVVLKGHRTLIVDPKGRAAVNPTGNPGMATGGTGDVLAGLAGALLARHEPWEAASAAVYLHGQAGDVAAARRGQPSLLAGDVLDAIPDALRALSQPEAGGRTSATT
jgi:ADP-dependent NAD(P)H-hydrate dehydratase / NAD(P)H-hydrate epimerase